MTSYLPYWSGDRNYLSRVDKPTNLAYWGLNLKFLHTLEPSVAILLWRKKCDPGGPLGVLEH